MDISGAYDKVWRRRLIHNLRKRGVPSKLLIRLESYLADRTVRIKLAEGLVDAITVNAGIPQGSPLSPILYLFYNADLLEIEGWTIEKALIMGYVDDTGMLVGGESTEANCKRLAELHAKAEEWAIKHPSSFAPAKYELIHFVHKLDKKKITNLERPVNMTMRNGATHSFQPTKSAWYLGIILDAELNWLSHLEHITKRVSQLVQAMQAISGSTWGVSRESLLRLYRTIIIPPITYACFVWFIPEAVKGTIGRRGIVIAKLEALQEKSLAVCTGAFRFTAAQVLCAETFTIPMDLPCRMLVLGTWARIRSSPTARFVEERKIWSTGKVL